MKRDSIQTDEELVEQFLTGGREVAESAFEVLVRRHGPMVLGVCRQILDRYQDAEDAFQETFLTLVSKAGAIQDRRVLRCWLYEVAFRIAIRVRARVGRHRWCTGMDRLAIAPERPEVDAARNELRVLLHDELDRLPEKHRTLVIQCYLEGKSVAEVARLLDCPLGTAKGRLSQARGKLRGRLKGSGLALDRIESACG